MIFEIKVFLIVSVMKTFLLALLMLELAVVLMRVAVTELKRLVEVV